MQHVEHFLVVVVPAQLADPVEQAEQYAGELKVEIAYGWLSLSIQSCATCGHLQIISGNVLCERVTTVSEILSLI